MKHMKSGQGPCSHNFGHSQLKTVDSYQGVKKRGLLHFDKLSKSFLSKTTLNEQISFDWKRYAKPNHYQFEKTSGCQQETFTHSVFLRQPDILQILKKNWDKIYSWLEMFAYSNYALHTSQANVLYLRVLPKGSILCLYLFLYITN